VKKRRRPSSVRICRSAISRSAHFAGLLRNQATAILSPPRGGWTGACRPRTQVVETGAIMPAKPIARSRTLLLAPVTSTEARPHNSSTSFPDQLVQRTGDQDHSHQSLRSSTPRSTQNCRRRRLRLVRSGMAQVDEIVASSTRDSRAKHPAHHLSQVS